MILTITIRDPAGDIYATEKLLAPHLCLKHHNHYQCQHGIYLRSQPIIISAAVYCCKHSSKFTISFIRYMMTLISKKRRAEICWSCFPNVEITLHSQMNAPIDYAWGHRLEVLSYKWSLLLDATAWLSTLGGGHSALGEDMLKHAEVAGRLSMKQLRLARELGNLELEYRCRLYYSLSLIQKGLLSQAKMLIRIIHHIAKHNLKDEKLQCMCQGVWSKLRYKYQIRKMLKPERRENNVQR